MNSTTTNMFAPRIWGSDFSSPQAQVALQAGWRRADILWEELMVAGNVAWLNADRQRAVKCFGRASWVARLCFNQGDLRRAAGLINRGIILREAGRTARASALFQRALSLWDTSAEHAVAEMKISPRARSSLFHLRMEARHRETYHDNFRVRMTKIASEVRTDINNLLADQPRCCRLYSRWIGERPAVFDDTRKVFGACLLIIDGLPTSSTQ